MHLSRYLACAVVLPVAALAQLANVSDDRTILGHPVIFDQQHHVLPWYQPETPGAAYGHVVGLASNFVLHRTLTEPKTGLPMYLTTCSISKPDLQGTVYTADNWANNPACIFAGAVQSFAIGYYGYTGDPAALEVVSRMLDHQLEHGTTPPTFAWPGVPYASADPFNATYEGAGTWEKDGMRGDGLHGIEPDKIGELGYAYVRFFEITGKPKYLQAALSCADVLAAMVRNVLPDPSTLSSSSVEQSPWPFRVNARTGTVISDYCSNVLDPIKLFDELLRLRERIGLTADRQEHYRSARDLAWKWLYSRNGPMKTFIWNAYFEDIPNDPARANRLQITPGELAKYLAQHPNASPAATQDAATLLRWIATVFKAENWDAINEQTWCYEPMGSHTARYGAACALLYERTGEAYFKDQAYRFLNFATYMTLADGYVAVGPNWPGSWWSDGYTDYVRHFLDAMGAVPEWAPAGENHLLRSSSPVQHISYTKEAITLTTFEAAADLVFRLASEPTVVRADGVILKRSDENSKARVEWKALANGGVLTLHSAPGRQLQIEFVR